MSRELVYNGGTTPVEGFLDPIPNPSPKKRRRKDIIIEQLTKENKELKNEMKERNYNQKTS